MVNIIFIIKINILLLPFFAYTTIIYFFIIFINGFNIFLMLLTILLKLLTIYRHHQ